MIMFRKTRRKIVGSVMGAMLILLAVTLSVIVLSSYLEARRQAKEMLEVYVNQYSLDALPWKQESLPPSEMDGPPKEAPLYELSTFYSVAFSDEEEVLAVDTGRNDIYSREDLVEIAKKLKEKGSFSGHTLSLTYRIAEKDGYTLIAFLDSTLTDESFHSLIQRTLITGIAAIAVCFILSDYLAYRIVKPLEDNDRKQRQFISDAGHELKTPVSIISSNAEVLSRQIGTNDWLDNIRYENERMSKLVIKLLELSKAENGKLQKEEIDLSMLVTGEVLPFEAVAFEKKLSIQSDIEDGILISGTRSQLSQLVSILLDNAIKYSQGGKKIVISLKKRMRIIQLTVENNGEAIPQEKMEHLFERFYRVDETRNGEDGNYGLGLAIAKAIVEEHDGSIGVSCKNGKVIFTVRIHT